MKKRSIVFAALGVVWVYPSLCSDLFSVDLDWILLLRSWDIMARSYGGWLSPLYFGQFGSIGTRGFLTIVKSQL